MPSFGTTSDLSQNYQNKIPSIFNINAEWHKSYSINVPECASKSFPSNHQILMPQILTFSSLKYSSSLILNLGTSISNKVNKQCLLDTSRSETKTVRGWVGVHKNRLFNQKSIKSTNSVDPDKMACYALRKHAYSNILIISPPKTENFQIKKNFDIFHISAQNIDCGYSLEPPL